MLTKDEILDYLKEIKPKLQEDGIVKLGLFGSFAKDTADIASDVDITIETTGDFVKKHSWGGIIYLDNLRERFMRKFKRQVDLCDTASMSKQKQQNLLTGVIYV
ncbi:TPA: nucleotidyltransferase domain-containing protein [Campylobacter fetus subsp. venerealis]|uniref:Nucleotidyltransferase domain-containing protein n=3 Tax=Campylobacter fetus TaxID=196 RepID=A0A7D7Q451_CAMFE|nr:nucleotidyltransferase domain-containing protein [Campylobacter fetus]OCS21207.1 nucleotidyltransferase [Campylobacter fetus subsp. venerealis cfvi97/532]OCS25267.1 nucleotidyltransferase [Campylobacter fetus subsp. venerealis cfvB10]OCS28999.1 nucleotidyltransferase [Campylobacter fetus subsp. venerealis LMG 6570 = CCUG 33900]OCS40945.1 nucleotidyltransferase [Campylobacter fetus subsp. venerealis cfvi02/298]ACA64460.1 nucleotidyltransferase [Campylobacter fetus subsp. venerealis NCTC 1035